MKLLYPPFLVMCLLSAFPLYTQTELSGVINSYAEITSIDTCGGSVEVVDTAGFEIGMPVLLIQMKGASINRSNTASYGEVIDLLSCGLYERATIQSMQENTITFENVLIHNYSQDPGTDKLQLVSIPVYEKATVMEELNAPVWDGSKGGVIILEVTDTLFLQANINANGLGFRGGVSSIQDGNDCNFLINHNNYSYPINNFRGAPKGEGIAITTQDQYAGRGPLANGGGGGNDHNSGGGGGSHINFGGVGGRNNEPSNFGCDGNFPGLGGKRIPQDGNRIFFGGGGGAGHENNMEGTDGGHGGGIVLVIANTIIGNDQRILANGLTPIDGGGDGAGGGGAGGTIILDAQTVTGLSLEARGGNGGLINNGNADRCHGPGGGGAGGRIITDLPNLGINTDGGNAGLGINSSECGDGTNGAQDGEDGIVENFEEIPTSDMPFGNEITVLQQPQNIISCLGLLDSLEVDVDLPNANFQWQVDLGNGFENLIDNILFSGSQTSVLQILPDENMNGLSFRVLVSAPCFEAITSDEVILTVDLAPDPSFTFEITDDFTVIFTNTSTNSDTYSWNFGDGSASVSTENPTHTFDLAGEYLITLTGTNSCGSAPFEQIIVIESAPNAGFSSNISSGCALLEVSFQNQSSDNADNFVWVFPGANPNTSGIESPTVQYAIPGTYDVQLIAINEIGRDTLLLEDYITVLGPPTPGFSGDLDGLEVTFSNQSLNADTYFWDFGDNTSSNEENPIHTFSEPGTYTVTLTVTNACGTDELSIEIMVGAAPEAAFSNTSTGGCAPFIVQFSNTSSGNYNELLWTFPGGMPATSTEEMPVVTYLQAGVYDVGLSINGTLGNSSILQEEFVTILTFPEPAFEYEFIDGTISFTNQSEGATRYVWDFGDGSSSNEENPSHSYTSGGAYTVTLNALNAYCGSSTSQTINIILTSSSNQHTSDHIKVYPNPVSSQLNIDILNQEWYPANASLFNLQGQLILQKTINQSTTMDINRLASGIYILRIQAGDALWNQRIIIQQR